MKSRQGKTSRQLGAVAAGERGEEHATCEAGGHQRRARFDVTRMTSPGCRGGDGGANLVSSSGPRHRAAHGARLAGAV